MGWRKSYPDYLSHDVACISFGMIFGMGCLFDSQVVRRMAREWLRYSVPWRVVESVQGRDSRKIEAWFSDRTSLQSSPSQGQEPWHLF